jgi:hypothetical protein
VKDDATFLRDLQESDRWRLAVADWIASHGYTVTVPVTHVRPSAATRMAHGDDGDVFVEASEGFQRVEVKARNIMFTGAHDYPYRDVFVDEQYKVEAAHTWPLWGYVILASDRRHVAIVPGHTQPQWLPYTRFDKAQNRMCTSMSCPIPLVQFTQWTF